MADKNTIKSWFLTALFPTQAQFWEWIDSYWHKDEPIPQSAIEGLESTLDQKAELQAFNTHVNDAAAHGTKPLQATTTVGNTTDKGIVIQNEQKLRLSNGDGVDSESEGHADFNFIDGLQIAATDEGFTFNNKNVGRSVDGVAFDYNGNADIGALTKGYEGEATFSDTGTLNALNWGNKKTMRWVAADNSTLVISSINDPATFPGKIYILENATVDTDDAIESAVYLYDNSASGTGNLKFSLPKGVPGTNGISTTVFYGQKLVFVHSGATGKLELAGVNVSYQDLQRMLPAPDEFICVGSISSGYFLRYKAGSIFRGLNLSSKVTITRPTGTFNEILRNDKDLFLISGNDGTSSTNKPYIMALRDFNIVDNILTWSKIDEGLINLDYRIHGSVYDNDNGQIYISTRSATNVQNQLVRVNPYNLTDQSTYTFSDTPIVSGINSIDYYKGGIYMFAASLGSMPYSQRFIRFDENLTSYETIFSFNLGGNMNALANIPFAIDNEEIYFVTGVDNGGTDFKRASVFVYSMQGQLLRSNENFALNDASTTLVRPYKPHWITIMNGHMIVTATDSGCALTTLRIKCSNLVIEENWDSRAWGQFGDDNTITKAGILYLCNEGTGTNGVLTCHYLNMAATVANVSTTKASGCLEYKYNNKESFKPRITVYHNPTTTALNRATLNSTYPKAAPGDQVICENITAKPQVYEKAKTAGNWLTLDAILTP